ncbi:hypothetical protein EV426DRAFT_673461 [Tirmania nivea]|nr:hypothetical protein EV426DRAFT_673461 [Tirmania nivea]
MEPLFATLAIGAIGFLPQPYPIPNVHSPVLGVFRTHLTAVTLLLYPGDLTLPQSGGTYTESPHQLTFSDENGLITVWFLVRGHAMEHHRCAVTFHLTTSGVDRLGFGNATPLRERMYDIKIAECRDCDDYTAHDSAIVSDENDLKSSNKLLKHQEKLENTKNWLQNLPLPDDCSTEESHFIELRSQDDPLQETLLAPQLEQSTEFYRFEDLPLEIRRYIIGEFAEEVQFSSPFLNDAEQLIIAPEEWRASADGDHPGGPTAFSGWGNAWMIQDAFRACTKVKRLALSLGSTGDNSWALTNSSLNLSNLTHLHLDVPLPRHFHPGSSSLERFKSYSPASGLLPSFPNSRPTAAASHHLCPAFALLAPRLEVLSLHGAGAHICNELLDAPWIKLRELYASLDAESGGVCHGALASSKNAARRLARRLPSLDMRLSLLLMDDNTHKKEPYLWGGRKPQNLETPFVILPDEPSVCCLACVWGIACRTKEPGHRTQEGRAHFKRLFEVYRHRLRESTIGWLGELGWTRCFHQYDPLCDLRDHCGDVYGDWLRVQSNNALPKPDRWLDTSVAPLGDLCGIKRGRNLEGCIRPTTINNFSFEELTSEECDPSGKMSLRNRKVKDAVAVALIQAWLQNLESESSD